MKHTFRGCIALLTATVIWGCAFVAQSVGMDHIGPFAFQAIRCALGVAALIPIILVFDAGKQDQKSFFRRWLSPGLWKTGIPCGVALFIATGLQQIALIDTDAGKAGFFTAMYIVIVPLIGAFLGKRLAKTTLLGVVLAVIGLYLLSGAGAGALAVGDICLMLCAVSFAVQITLIDRMGSGLDGLRLNCVQCLVCAVLSAVVMLFTESPTLHGITACAVPLLYTGILSMGVAYSLQIIGQQHVDSVPASLIMSLESVFAALAGALALHERMTTTELMGCILVFSAVVLSQLPSRAK